MRKPSQSAISRIMSAFGRQSGKNMTAEQRSARGRKAVQAREARRAIERYEQRVQSFENMGMTRSDAQALVDADDLKTIIAHDELAASKIAQAQDPGELPAAGNNSNLTAVLEQHELPGIAHVCPVAGFAVDVKHGSACPYCERVIEQQ